MQRKWHEKAQFRIENPQGRRKTFRIRYTSPDTSDKWTTLESPEIDAANDQLLAGHPQEKVKKALKVFLKTLYAERDQFKKQDPFLSHNLAIVDRLWKDKYTARRKMEMKRPDESLADYRKAVEACGQFPLDTCSIEDLENHLFRTLKHQPNILRRRITWINSILQWLSREKIKPPIRKQRPEVAHLTEPEFKKIIKHLSEEDSPVIQIAFYTGLRIGEIFGLETRFIKENTVLVKQQLSEELEITTTKTDNEREAIYPPHLKPILKKWASLPLVEKKALRSKTWSKVVRRVCKKVFEDESKHIRFHDLRHSNAIWLLSKGATLHEVAQHLGNHHEVTERYYSGFNLKETSIHRVAGLLKG